MLPRRQVPSPDVAPRQGLHSERAAPLVSTTRRIWGARVRACRSHRPRCSLRVCQGVPTPLDSAQTCSGPAKISPDTHHQQRPAPLAARHPTRSEVAVCSWWPSASATSRRRVRMRRSTACAAAPAPAAAQPADGGAPHRSAASVARRRGSTRAVVARPARPLRRIAGSTERTRSPSVAPQAGQLGRVQGGRPCAAQGGRRPSAASSRGPRGRSCASAAAQRCTGRWARQCWHSHATGGV